MRIAMICARGHHWHAKSPQSTCPYCGGAARLASAPTVPAQRHPTNTPPPVPPPVPPRPAPEPQAPAKPAPAVAVSAPGQPAPVQSLSTEINWTRVDVAPTLPMAVFTSTERWNGQRIGAMAIYCSDGRWGDACDEFCHRSLLIPRYDRFAVPGGPAWICQANSDEPELYRAAHGQLEYLVRTHELERIVLITHYDCAFYKHHLKREARECLPAQFEDVKKAAAILKGWFREISLEGYLAMQAGNVLSFHQLEL